MRTNKIKIIIGIIALAIIILIFHIKSGGKKSDGMTIVEEKPFMGSIKNIISTTGTVLPKNRLEIKPPVNGRVEEILVKEGQKVKPGQTLAWMSSTERAALLDAARGQGEEVLKYWQEVYKAIPLMSPINGEVIVATTQPGQTVASSDSVIVLSDKLIVRAQVDETDIGKIMLNQNVEISLDAYPDVKIKSEVDHIYYESKTVNNVTIYEVDVIPENVPDFFRSGMNASVDFIVSDKSNVMLIPSEFVIKENSGDYVMVKDGKNKVPEKRNVKLGVADNKNIEVLSGVGVNDTIILKSKKYSIPEASTGKNPFMPNRRPKKESK